MNFKSFLIEQQSIQEDDRFSQAYNRYVKHFIDNFGIGKNKYPTPQWVAGTFTNFRHTKPTESQLSDNGILKDFKDYFAERKLISKNQNKTTQSVYYYPTDAASKFVQYLMKRPEDDLIKIMRELGYQADQDWAGSLPAEDKQTLETFKNISSEDYEYLMGILSSKESKKNYTNKLDTTSINNEDRLFRLKDLGLINENNTINVTNVKKLMNFIEKYGYSQLKDFNNDMRYTAKRLSANRALADNLLNKMLSGEEHYGSELVTKASSIIDLNNNAVNKLINRDKLTKSDVAELKNLMLVSTDNKITELGTAVIARGKIKRSAADVKTGMDDLKNVRIDAYDKTDWNSLSREEKIARIASSNKAQRQNQKVAGRAKQFSDL